MWSSGSPMNQSHKDKHLWSTWKAQDVNINLSDLWTFQLAQSALVPWILFSLKLHTTSDESVWLCDLPISIPVYSAASKCAFSFLKNDSTNWFQKGNVAQLCLTLCNPMNCSCPGSSAHGILQARILEWVAMPSSRGSSQPRNQTWVSCITGGFFTVWATRKARKAL